MTRKLILGFYSEPLWEMPAVVRLSPGPLLLSSIKKGLGLVQLFTVFATEDGWFTV